MSKQHYMKFEAVYGTPLRVVAGVHRPPPVGTLPVGNVAMLEQLKVLVHVAIKPINRKTQL